ncbi:dihydroneopterin aldolase [Actibacterium mucosum KCTC 23349]|uniref:Dihydroneopterin aldolase n=1 Tax=Actibacterium mucosum KCTC 23349 TaxID=1454373 RepID=A0A037ZKA8_9RHOB|nr:disulfide bond formation protein B [Actibacterium mucosum]KAJ56856.1 dihydroneopterin aldolase [Actibacterium mucosum KCTC 23349]
MTRTQYILLAAGGSAALLLGAFAFQHLGGLAPCKLCLWQRWPHAAAIVIGVAALAFGARFLAVLGGLAALATAGIGIYHTGVEHKWWQGPTSCSGGGNDLGALSGGDLLNFDSAVNVVMCDEVVWSLAGLSMASWNAIVALVLAGMWFAAARAKV